MALVLIAFCALAIVTPFLANRFGTHVFTLIGLLPLAAFVFTLSQGPDVFDGTAVTWSVAWIPELGLELAFRVDALAWVLALVVTGIGALVLFYCAHYFAPTEPGLGRFAALLLAFAGTMYGLVTSDNIIIMFMFWEITSVLSYLLIGHYTGRKESRGAALQALLVTTFGGLVMLVGVIMLSVQAGTSTLSVIVESALRGPMAVTAIMLVLVGALSKSAIVPFHFWLPAAMAAPTPVSAYLHAAAMVKAGVYLVARLAPGYSELPGWTPVLVSLGVWTMLVGAWRSLRQYDLKLVLAYGTVSQLGFLMVVTGFGTRDAALAATALLVAHALYKATLFLSVGIIDHRAGTRDWRHLSGVGRGAPALAVIAGIAALSMAGAPPLLGFVAKEAVFTAFWDAGIDGNPWGWVALWGTAIGSVMTVGYSIRFMWGAFATRQKTKTTELSDQSWRILVSPAVLATITIVAGLAASSLNAIFAPYADTVVGADHAHLALWHGFVPALAISAAVIVGGVLLFLARARIARMQEAVPPLVDSARSYWDSVRFIDRLAARVTLFAQRGGLAQYLSTVLIVFVLALGGAATVNRTWPDSIRAFDYPAQPIIGALMVGAAVMAARARQRMTAVLLAGVTGYGMVALFAFHGAPDLALTQALVEMATIVTFVLVLRRLPVSVSRAKMSTHKVRRAIIGIAFGSVMAVIAVIALGARQADSVALEYPRLAVEEGHGANIVNVALVDIRAWDTMGEISVLVVVATGIASMLFVSGRAGAPPRISGAKVQRQPANRRRVVRDPIAPGDERTATRQTWLLAGRTLSARHRSLMLEVFVRLLFHPAIVVSIYLLFVGHNLPGGGFAGGLLAGLALVARYLAGGRYELAEAVPIPAGYILGAGNVLAVGTAVASLFFGADVLTSAYVEWEWPLLGSLSFGTTTIFDIGVYLVVIGLTVDLLRSLGAEIDRQQETLDPDNHRRTEATR